MKNSLVHFLILFVSLIVAQVICSKVILFSVAMPIVYIYLILRLPLNYSLNWTLTIAFLFGLFVDMFNNTQGMNALACVMMTIVIPYFSLISLRSCRMDCVVCGSCSYICPAHRRLTSSFKAMKDKIAAEARKGKG